MRMDEPTHGTLRFWRRSDTHARYQIRGGQTSNAWHCGPAARRSSTAGRIEGPRWVQGSGVVVSKLEIEETPLPESTSTKV
jgi:hypothetical protein